MIPPLSCSLDRAALPGFASSRPTPGTLLRSLGRATSHLLRCGGTALGVFVAALFASVLASSATAQVVSNTFDDLTTQGWGPRGSVAVVSSTEVARSGSASLKTTGRTATWNGPVLDLRARLARNATYQVSGWVRLAAGQPASALKFTLERTPVAGSTTYSQVTAPQTVTDGAWVQLQGTLSLPAEDNTVCVLYLESDDATSAYHLDDFTITALTTPGCPQPLDQSGLFTDFESGTNQGWTGRGPAVLTNVTGVSQSGTRSLSVTGRAASWQGPSINALCKLHRGSKYLVSLWVRLLPGETASDIRVSLQAGLGGVTTYNTVIGNTRVTDAAWVNLRTEYTFALDVDQLSLYVETASGTASFYVDDFVLTYLPTLPIQTNIPSLKEVLEPYFPLGAAIEEGNLVGVQRQLLLKHYSQITAGNAMKWDALQPTEGNFNWARADAFANFARQNGLRMRGHTLLWHAQTPAWVFQDAAGQALQPNNPAHRTLLLQRLRTHIHAVVPRYLDIIDSWDVVNEVIDPSQPGGLRNSPWLQIIGPDFIDHAFRYAAEVAGDTALFINDYSTEDAAKREALRVVVQGLLDRNVPVDGVGHQAHINVAWPSMDAIRQTLQTFAAMGLMNEITEFDMSAYTNSTSTAPVSQETLVLQGYRYRDVFNVYREQAAIINSVTIWGLGDDSSWLKTSPITRDDKPLPFDEQLQAKPAYWGIVDPTQLPIDPKAMNITRVSKWTVGVAEAFWNALAPEPLSTGGNAPSTATFRSVWNGDKVYIRVDVTDKTRSSSDLVEVFLGSTRYTFRALGVQSATGANAVGVPNATGYVVYAVLPAGQALSVGGSLALDVRVTDSATKQKQSWSDTNHTQETDLDARGTLNLIGQKRTARTLRGTPVIDGYADTLWNATDMFETKSFVLGSSGATAQVRTLWDDGHLYVYAIVTDPLLSKASPNPWEEDSVEIFVDANNGQTVTYQADDSQFRVNYDNERSFGGGATAARIVSSTRTIPGGYIVEAALAIDGLAAREGGYIGFDLQVNNDGAGDGVRSSVALWNDTTGNAYLDPSQFGALQLMRGNR